MKKINEKQKAWANNQAVKYTNRLKKQFFMLIAFFTLLLAGSMYAAGDISAEEGFGGGTIATVMAGVGNIDQAPEKEKKGKSIKSKLWILGADQVDDTVAFPARENRDIGTIPLKAGEYWHYIDTVEDQTEAKWKGEEGDIVTSTGSEISAIVGGMSDAVMKLLEDGAGKKFYIVWEPCGRDAKYLGGDGCKPMKFVGFEGGSTKDNTSTTLTFKNESAYLWSNFVGSIQTQDPDTVAADATAIPLTDNSNYELTGGSSTTATIADFSGVTDVDINRYVTVKGLGGVRPAEIEASTKFILVTGEKWTATLGASITFKILKTGGSAYTFMEVPSTRV